MASMPYVFLYVTASSRQECRFIAKRLLEKKLIACANVFPAESIYRWENKTRQEAEHIMILKTRREKVKRIREEIGQVHSYAVSCITEISVEPNEAYAKWLEQQL